MIEARAICITHVHNRQVCLFIFVYRVSRADPGFEVRGGANGFDNLKTRGGHIYFKYTTITITYIYISITIHFKISNTTIFLFQQAPYTILF